MKIRRSNTNRRVKRQALGRALISLALGSVLTVAVAWGCALFAWKQSLYWPVWVDIPSGATDLAPYQPDYFIESGPFPFRVTGDMVKVTAVDETGAQTVITRVVRKDVVSRYHYGFPFKSMTAVSGIGSSGMPWEVPDLIRDEFLAIDASFEVPQWFPERFHPRRPPLRLLWPGFLYSVLVYGTLAWLMLFAPGLLRSHRRLRRLRCGICVQCKYPVDEFAVCPECGTAVAGDQ